MVRPFPLQVLPPRLRQAAYYHLYHDKHAAWSRLFERAPLAFGLSVSMYDLVPGDAISGCIAFTGSYELGLTQRIAHQAANGGLLIDVGANMGYFSLLWASANRWSRVIAFEPAPRNIQLFQNNIVRNRLSDRITLVPKAVAEHPGNAMFEVGSPEQTGWGGLSDDPTVDRISVPVVCLDDELGDTHIDVLKIDAEGADALVLRGAHRLLENRLIDTIYFEENIPRMVAHGFATGDIQAHLRSFGYECRSFGDNWFAHPRRDPTRRSSHRRPT